MADAWAASAEALADWALTNVCVRRDAFGAYGADGRQHTAKEELGRDVLLAHFRGERIIGLHTTSPDGHCLGVTIDIDAHGPEADPDANLRFARRVAREAAGLGLRPLVLDSNGRGGYHVRILTRPIPSEVAHWFGRRLVAAHAEDGLPTPPESFPKQAGLNLERPFGNWIRLPGRHHRRDHWCRILDLGTSGTPFLEGADAIERLLGTGRDDPARLLRLHRDEADPVGDRRREASAGRAGRAARTRGDLPRPDEGTVRSALACLPDELLDGYESWLAVGMGLHDWDEVDGLDLWHEASRRSPKYDEAELEAKWRSFTPGGGITVGTIFAHARENGWQQSPSGRGGSAAASGPVAARTAARTEFGLAERFVGRSGRDVRYCYPWKKFLVWDGRRFRVDETGRARDLAKQTVRSLYEEAATLVDDGERREFARWATDCETRKTIDAVLGLVSHESGIPILPDEMDRDPWLLNCTNGTIDLRSGRLRPHDRADALTKLCPVAFDPEAACPLWLETLRLFLRGDEGLVGYLQRLCGYAITGVVRDHILPVAYGTGSNGKSTILGTLLRVLGPDYAMKAPHDLLLARDRSAHPTERAALHGKRLVVAIETGDGRRLDETLVKELTGGDQITARRMREDLWSFEPTHKIVLATNHKPTVRGTDNGIWRRLRLVPFTHCMPEAAADRTVPERLLAEAPGILAWCVRGCLSWQQDGLSEPIVVTEATSGYRAEEDVIGQFIEDRCELRPALSIRAGELYAAYSSWADAAGLGVLSQVRFGKAIGERGIPKQRSHGTTYLGIGLRSGGGGSGGGQALDLMPGPPTMSGRRGAVELSYGPG